MIIVGGGPAGYVGALHAVAHGLRVTLIEAGDVGGTCLHRGCIPTKTLAAACSLLERIRRARVFGIRVDGQVSAQWGDVRGRMGDVVGSLTKGVEGLLADRRVELVRGRARLVDAGTVEIEGSGRIRGDWILICTGSRPARPAVFAFDGLAISTSDDLLGWENLPSSVAIVGEGIIASEFAFVLRSLGVAVTMVGMETRPLPTLDRDVSAVIARELKRRKIVFLGGRRVEAVRITGSQVEIIGRDGPIASAERALVCVGRVPNTAGIGPERAGIRTGSRGEIAVNDYMRTSAPGVYAAGDVTGRVMLAHAASAQARLAVEHMLGLAARPIEENMIPWAIFTSPEIGCVGLSEDAAVTRGHSVSCGKFDLRGLGKAQAMDEMTGLVKAVADAATGRLLGVHIVGAHASDIIHEAVVAMHNGVTVKDLGSVIHAHPTLSEAVAEALEDVSGQAIHKPARKVTDELPV